MTLFRSLYTYLVAAIVAVSPTSAMSGGEDDPLSQRAGYGMPGQAVDLGLSVLWSDHNVGATGPQDVGRFFGYGDITGTVTTCSYSDYVSQDVVGSDRDPAFVFWGGEMGRQEWCPGLRRLGAKRLNIPPRDRSTLRQRVGLSANTWILLVW